MGKLVRVYAPVVLVGLLALGAALVGHGRASSTGASLAQYQYGPTLAVAPAVGPPRSSITVSGGGFGASETVDLSFDSTSFAVATADASGVFTRAVKVPSYAIPGHHEIEATGRTSGLFAVTSFLVRTDWPTFRYSAPHTGTNPVENVLNPSSVADLKPAWFAPTGGVMQSSPTVAGGVVYVASGDQLLHAYDAAAHTQTWSAPVAMHPTFQSSPAVAGGVVYIGSYDGDLDAFSATTHALLWKGVTGGVIESSPVVSGQKVYVTSGMKLFAFNTGTHKLAWTFSMAGPVRSSPAVAGGVIYVGSFEGNLYAISVATHALLWTGATSGAPIVSSPTVVNGVAYVGSFDGKLYAFDTATHALLWTGTTGAAIESSPAVANGIAYVGSDDGRVYAFDIATHALVWTGSTGGHVTSSPAVANGVVYAGSEDGRILAWPARCSGACTPLWWYATSGAIDSSPAVVNGTVYVGSADHALYAFAVPSTITQPAG